MDLGRAMAPPTLLLSLLVVVILIGASIAPWSSVATVDERTYLEMALGIQEMGLPLVDNGPVERFPALQARWNYSRDGQMWGSMAPGFSYLSSQLMHLGGIRTVIRSNLALLALLTIAIFLIGRELTDQPEIGVAAAYVALLTIPVWTTSFGFLPYSFAITGFAWALFCASRALTSDSWTWALLAGLLAGVATTSQLLVFPMLVGLVAALAWSRPVLGLAATVGAVPFFTAMAWLNQLRFGSWNPLSDGPCAWQGCPDSGVDPQSVGQMVLTALPVLGWSVLGLATLWLLRERRTRTRVVGLLLIGLPIVALASLREGLIRYLEMGWRLLIDVGVWQGAENTAVAEDGLGTFIGPHVVKALLQSSPALVLIGFARLPRPKLALLWFPVAALFGMLLMRAAMPVDFALGHPFLNLRYLMPAAPPLAILAIIGARRLSWGLPHFALAALVAALLRWALWMGADDMQFWRRVLLLRGSLVVAAVVTAVVAMTLFREHRSQGRMATAMAAIAFGWGAGVSLGVDLAATIRLRDHVETRVDALESRLPARFALVGYPDQLDAPLTLRARRELEYLDLKEIEDWQDGAHPIRFWLDHERPVFLLLPPSGLQDDAWPDLEFTMVEPALGLAQVRAR